MAKIRLDKDKSILAQKKHEKCLKAPIIHKNHILKNWVYSCLKLGQKGPRSQILWLLVTEEYVDKQEKKKQQSL